MTLHLAPVPNLPPDNEAVARGTLKLVAATLAVIADEDDIAMVRAHIGRLREGVAEALALLSRPAARAAEPTPEMREAR